MIAGKSEAGSRHRPGGVSSILILAAALLVAGLPTSARAYTRSDVYRGTLGPYRIGADFIVEDWKSYLQGNYFYNRRALDIPLNGSVKDGDLILTEKGGGVFHLHFVVRGRFAPDLNFGSSTGLEGTWTRGSVSYPVELSLEFSAPWSGRPFYADVTRASGAAFEAMVRRFVHGVTAGDRSEAASAIHFPLRVNRSGGKPIFIRNRAELFRRWSEIFPPSYISEIKAVPTHDLFTQDSQAMIGDGEAWFDARGAVSINPPIAH